MLKTPAENNNSQSPSIIFGRSHSTPDEDRVVSFDNLLEARLALEVYDEILSYGKYKFKDTLDQADCVMQRIRKAEHVQTLAQSPYRSSFGKNSSNSENYNPLFQEVDILNKDSRSLWFNDSPMTMN